MHHLPAYVALARLVLARRVVVVLPGDLSGPRCLAQAGAREILVVHDTLASEPGIVVRPGSTQLPLRDHSVDVVCCIEAYGELPATSRAELLAESRRVLRPDGLFAAWIGNAAPGAAASGGPRLDFWSFETELGQAFEAVAILAQMPWQGFSVAPVLDEADASEPVLSLRETLLEAAPEATHYLAVASMSALPPALTRDCVLVPVPAQAALLEVDTRRLEDEMASLKDEIERLREELSLRAARGAAAQGRVRDLEFQLERVGARVGEAHAEELGRVRAALTRAEEELEQALEKEGTATVEARELAQRLSTFEARHAELQARQGEVRAQLEERTRQLEQREQELDAARRQLEEQREEVRDQGTIARSRETDLAILTRTVEDQEKALARLGEALAEGRKELERAREGEAALRARIDALTGEREELRRQVDVLIAEREGARKLASRVEAELELATRKIAEQATALDQRREETGRLQADAEGLRQRVAEQAAVLAQTRERADALSAQAAQGQVLSEVALDRNRLREELSHRQQQIAALEELVWSTREALQKEKLEIVRLNAEVERSREQLERSRAVESSRAQEVEKLSAELRGLEVARVELGVRLEARNDRIAQLEAEAVQRAGESADARAVQERMQERGAEIARLKEQLAQVDLRRKEATEQLGRREGELREAGQQILELQRRLDDQAKLAIGLQAEVDVKSVEVEQIAVTIGNLQAQLADYRAAIASGEGKAADLQRRLEQTASEERAVRQRLREREQELEDLAAAREADTLELFKLRNELDAAARSTEQLSEALAMRTRAEEAGDLGAWPAAALDEVQRLKEELAAQTRRHAEQISAQPARPGRDSGRARRLQLEVAVRAAEQEHMLGRLDAAEQRIWEMSDAADRNAARFEASLAQLERHKEKIDQLADELDVTRTLLAAEQARALELERLLASERAKMARAGIVEGFPRSEEVDDPFADLASTSLLDLSDRSAVPRKGAFELDSELVRLSSDDAPPSPSVPGAVAAEIHDRSSSGAFGSGSVRGADRAPRRARLVVETIDEDDDEWPQDGPGGKGAGA